MKKIHIVIINILFISFIWYNISSVSANFDGMQSVHYTTIQVKPGDTVWNIAARYTTPKDDIRNVVIDIKKINGLNNNVQIFPGQTLKVPLKVNK